MSTKSVIQKSIPPRVLSLAGSDSGGSAGLQADLKTFEARGVFGSTAITLVTAQDTNAVKEAVPLPEVFIRTQIETVLNDIGTDALKTGLLMQESTIHLAADIIQHYDIKNVVVDPVLIDGQDHQFVSEAALIAYRNRLFPLATFITPNLGEAALLTERTITSKRDLYQAARQLHKMGAAYVLIKGGHLAEDGTVLDLVFDGKTFTELTAPRLPIKNPHGVGCTLASAIAAELAKQKHPQVAVSIAHQYLQAALKGSLNRQIGSGRQPVYHAVDRPPLFED